MLTFVKFSATWCGPCKAFKPVFDQARKVNADIGVEFVEYDLDEDRTEAERHAVTGVPTVIALEDGVELDRMVGAHPPAIFQQFIDKQR